MQFNSVLLIIIFVFFIVGTISYVLGSINTSIIVTKYFAKKDIRKLGSGNAGFTNVLRSVGVLPSIIAFAGDFFKTFFAILISKKIVSICFSFFTVCDISVLDSLSKYIGSITVLTSGFFVIFGHVYPCFFNFKGGKAIVCLLPFTLLYDFRVSLLALSVFILFLVIFKMVSLASIVGTCSLPIFNFLLYILSGKDLKYVLTSTAFFVMISVLVIYKHSGNIKRIKNNTEYKIGSRRNKV